MWLVRDAECGSDHDLVLKIRQRLSWEQRERDMTKIQIDTAKRIQQYREM